MTTLVREAKALARQWVLDEASTMPGFYGAYFAGSTNWLAEDAILPASSDLDVHLVLDDLGTTPKLGKFIYHGVLLEVSSIPRGAVRSPEAVLGHYHLAGSFRTPSIILDPTGDLTALQTVVAHEYAQRRWVRKRCEHAAEGVRNFARSLDEAKPLHDQATSCTFAAGVTTHVLLVAGLQNPTVRKRYVASRALLAEYRRLDFQETLLALLGCAHLDRARVEQHLRSVAATFDAAKGVIRTPYRFASDISDAARPISIDGNQELIERGLHREAVFWLVATSSRCRTILAADAPELLARFDPGYRALLADLGIASFADRQRRCMQVVAGLPRVWEVAEEIMAENPGIRD